MAHGACRYRSYYNPVKNVIDGDLCEQYVALLLFHAHPTLILSNNYFDSTHTHTHTHTFTHSLALTHSLLRTIQIVHCTRYNSLDGAKKRAIAEDLDRTPAEVSKKLEEIRNRYAF